MHGNTLPDLAAEKTRRGWIVGSAIAAGVLVAVGVFGFQEWRLARNLRLAERHAPLIREKLQHDDRFLGVVVKESTTLHGSLRVGGFVLDDVAAADLRGLIEATSPPVAIDWQFRILGAAAVGEALSKIQPPTSAPTQR
jgi:hypothetical protein